MKRKRSSLTLPRTSKKKLYRKSKDEYAGTGGEDNLLLWSPAIGRAQEILANLDPEFPGFWKPVLRSNVAGRFCLYLPKQFCDVHLPNQDGTIVLVDEDEEEYAIKYVLLRNKLDGGWRRFSTLHNLQEGDAFVFHLIDHCKFKVYIVRASEVDGALVPPNSDTLEKPMEAGQSGRSHIDKLGSIVPTRIRSSDYLIKFEDIKDFEDFKICVDGWSLDSEIPAHLREKYYELCCSQNAFLHNQLIEGLSRKLAVGLISETANISDAIRSANLTTSLECLENWDKTLEALEILGMSVAFLRGRVHKLATLAFQSESISESKKKKKAQLDNDFKALKATVLKVKVVMDGLEAEVDDLEAKNEKLSFEFKELASAPW